MTIKRKLILTVVACTFTTLTFSQPGGGSGPGSGNPVPITGIEILIGLGGLYGAKKALDRRKQNP